MGKKTEEFLDKVDKDAVKGEDILLFVGAIQELSEENEDVKDLLEEMNEEGEDIELNFEITDAPYTASIAIAAGKIEAKETLLEAPILTIRMDQKTAIDILSQKASMMKAYQEGNIQIEGDLMQVAGLAILLNVLGDELGVM